MEIDTTTVVIIAILQALQLGQTAVLGRVVRKSIRPPPARGTPIVYEGEREDATPSRRRRSE